MLKQLPQWVQGCYSDHPATQFECTQKIRKLLCIVHKPPIKAVVDSGVVTRLVQFLQREKFNCLQFEAAWALTNIASGTAENTAVIIRYGAVPIFVKLLKSNIMKLREQAIWALANISGNSVECRNFVLNNNVLSLLLPLYNTNIETKEQITLLRNATWILNNFCRGKPLPDWKYIQLILKALNIMIRLDDDEILQDTCWAFSYLCDTNDNNNMRAIINSGSLNRLITLLNHSLPQVRHPALRTIGNIVTGCDEHTQYVINLGVLKKLYDLIRCDNTPIKREACWTISNINGDDINGNIGQNVPVKSTRIRVGRNIHGYGLSPGILKHDKLAVEKLIKGAFKSLKGELAGMDEKTRQQLVDDHFLFMSGVDENDLVSGFGEGDGIESMSVTSDYSTLIFIGSHTLVQDDCEINGCVRISVNTLDLTGEIPSIWSEDYQFRYDMCTIPSYYSNTKNTVPDVTIIHNLNKVIVMEKAETILVDNSSYFDVRLYEIDLWDIDYDPSITTTKYPTTHASYNPTITSKHPTETPSINPTISPSNPTLQPTNIPSISPTSENPSISSPTLNPSIFPSKHPTAASEQPTETPSKYVAVIVVVIAGQCAASIVSNYNTFISLFNDILL